MRKSRSLLLAPIVALGPVAAARGGEDPEASSDDTTSEESTAEETESADPGDEGADESAAGDEADDLALVVRTRSKVVPAIGEQIGLAVEAPELRFFDTETRLAI